jgi:uncharacterized OB-fold protein
MRYVGESSLGYSVVDPSDPMRLLGSRCPVCGDVRVPARKLCPNDTVECESLALTGEGTLYEAVRIELAPEGFESPYWVGYVDLDEGARLFARIGGLPAGEQPQHGDRVRMSIEALAHDDDGPIMGPVFWKVDG